MKLILTQDVADLGLRGDVVDVADGYARNYLVPRALGMKATRGALKDAEKIRATRLESDRKARESAEDMAQVLTGTTVVVAGRGAARGGGGGGMKRKRTTSGGFRPRGGAAAPHNTDAEESVLGAVMLSADAANVALEVLQPDDFYKPSHQSVWEAVTALFDGNQPIDPITVADWLRRRELLDRVGGVGFITRLMEAVPSTSNVDYYVGIVDETSARRRLLPAGSA